MTAKNRTGGAALRRERDDRWDAGETIAAIDADFAARGIDPRGLDPRNRAAKAQKTAYRTPEAKFRTFVREVVTEGLDARGVTGTAPSQAEIREHIEGSLHEDATLGGRMYDVIGECAGAVEALYDLEDFRPSETAALDRCIATAINGLRRQFLEDLAEAVVGAAVGFAAEHPDAPRAVREPVPA